MIRGEPKDQADRDVDVDVDVMMFRGESEGR
jgi:hypothetical protein